MLTEQDKIRKQQAEAIIQLINLEAYSKYLRPFLINLAQEGYPQPSKYDTKEKLIIDYTQKVGETEAVKKIMKFLEEQVVINDQLIKKQDTDSMEPYRI